MLNFDEKRIIALVAKEIAKQLAKQLAEQLPSEKLTQAIRLADKALQLRSEACSLERKARDIILGRQQ